MHNNKSLFLSVQLVLSFSTEMLIIENEKNHRNKRSNLTNRQIERGKIKMWK